MGFDPFTTVVIHHDILVGQSCSRRIIEAGEAAEQKNITNLFEAFVVWLEIDDFFQFGFGKVSAILLNLLSL
ncbi:MAG: hypothetical protein ACLR8Y_20935 [Alistipes indistinctus]